MSSTALYNCVGDSTSELTVSYDLWILSLSFLLLRALGKSFFTISRRVLLGSVLGKIEGNWVLDILSTPGKCNPHIRVLGKFHKSFVWYSPSVFLQDCFVFWKEISFNSWWIPPRIYTIWHAGIQFSQDVSKIILHFTVPQNSPNMLCEPNSLPGFFWTSERRIHFLHAQNLHKKYARKSTTENLQAMAILRAGKLEHGCTRTKNWHQV